MLPPRRVWDLYSNRVVPWWSARKRPDPISHAWMDEKDRVNVWTRINGKEWPVPIPKDTNLNLIRIEMLNLGMEYTWLDVLCLRQEGGPREELRAEEWKLDVPTIGGVYVGVKKLVFYLSGLGRPLSLKEGDLDDDRCWFRRAWTLQEISRKRIIAGDTPHGPLHAKPIDKNGNYETQILTRFHHQLESLSRNQSSIFTLLADMQNRVSTNPVDKVAGLAFRVYSTTIPAYYHSQSLEDAWMALMNTMSQLRRGTLFFRYPEVGRGSKKWKPTWEQVMMKPLPADADCFGSVYHDDKTDTDWYKGYCIEKAFVQGLAAGLVEGVDRCGELIVEDPNGTIHAFKIIANHKHPIPEDTYTLIGSEVWYIDGTIRYPQYWAVGRRFLQKRFEKMSVFVMNDLEEVERLKDLGIAAESRNVLV
ncbi:hypothetical protein DFS33DRAFT_1283998 [Desarmillaria ectypa]|nr:hypothetical protein DFS33DRAFT_1283998 [Desarmillaria ectypa]